MNVLTLKPKSVGAVGPSRTLQSLTMGSQSPALSGWRTPSTGKPILLLARFTGTMLIGIGVVTMLATSLLCGGVLFQGPSFVIELLISLII